ncbi:MAG: hypothetical protein ACFFHV_22915 [Promethearchaeota archaeon]
MEREKPREKPKESELEALRRELARLRELKRQKELKELKEKETTKETAETIENEEIESEARYQTKLDDIENKLNEIDKFLLKQFEDIDQRTYEQHADYIETQLQTLEEEIIGEKGVIEKELSPYEQLLNEYPWLEETKYEFMYTIPNKKKNPNDYESWKVEWSKVMFDYAKYAILHIIYLREVISEKPFSNFQNRQVAVKEIADELVNQELAKFISKKKYKLRVYWKTLDVWADNLYDWAIDSGKVGPILIYEIRESNQKGLNNLPKDDLEEVFRILSKNNRGTIIRTDDGQIAFKIKLE